MIFIWKKTFKKTEKGSCCLPGLRRTNCQPRPRLPTLPDRIPPDSNTNNPFFRFCFCFQHFFFFGLFSSKFNNYDCVLRVFLSFSPLLLLLLYCFFLSSSNRVRLYLILWVNQIMTKKRKKGLPLFVAKVDSIKELVGGRGWGLFAVAGWV